MEYDSIREPNLPPAQIDDGDEALTSLITGPDVNGDIEIAARDLDGDRIELSASELFSNGSIVIAGLPLFSIASEAFEQQIDVLNVFRQLGDSSSAVRASIWDAANEALEDHVFGASESEALGRSYSSGGTQARRDEDALEILDDVLTALSSPGRFEDSLGDDGIFEGVLGSESSLDRYDFNAIYGALAYELEVQFGYTDYTRFGAWTKLEQDYAVSGNRQGQPSTEDPDVFAYSPLEQAVYRSNDSIFPSNSRATYTGQTRAVHSDSNEPLFYDGAISVTVEWGDFPDGSAVYTVLRDLVESSTGYPFAYNGFDVEEIVFSGMSTRTDSDRRVGFSSSSPTVRVRYFDISRRDSGFTGAKRHEGKFVGLSYYGPVGVIGTWELGDIKGAYGADLLP